MFKLLFLIFFASAVFACDHKPATRIISLAPDITEILFAIGAGDNIVGVMQGSDYPSDAKKIPIVANYIAINQEAILLLHPDLIVAWDVGNTKEQMQFFEKLHIPVFLVHPKEMTDIAIEMKNLGCLVGKEKFANRVADNFLNRYEKLKLNYSKAKKVSVFYEVWNKPLMTINRESWINQVISLCGGRNIFANVKGSAPIINPEAVIAADPDFIIAKDDDWKEWPRLKAVRLKHIVQISPDLLERAGPRLIVGAEELCSRLDGSQISPNANSQASL